MRYVNSKEKCGNKAIELKLEKFCGNFREEKNLYSYRGYWIRNLRCILIDFYLKKILIREI